MNWKVIWRSFGHADMRKRVLAVLGMIVIFRVLAQIPIPLASPTTLKSLLDTLFTATNGSGLFGFLDVLSGGALANFSIVLIGLGPYINASIIMQLLTQAIPKLEALNQEGEYGRKKINQITRIITLPLAIVQSIGAIVLVRQQAQQISGLDITANAGIGNWVVMITALVGGAMLLMWLGELITEQSVGNGISLLITAGIVAKLPSTISSLVSSVFSGEQSFQVFGKTINYRTESLYIGIGIFVAVIFTTWAVVKLNEAQRQITINYAKRVQGNRTYGGVTTILPIKLIIAGVIPVIFAVAFLSVPSFVGQILTNNSSARLADLGNNLVLWFQTPTSQTFAQPGWTPYIYPITYFVLIVAFTFFYTSITFNAKEIAENLQKQGGFIEGVRSGKDTEKFLKTIVSRLTLFGSLALGLIALGPIIAQIFINTQITIGGTGILILVAVALETLRQIESRALMVTYDDYSSEDYFDGDKKKSKKAKRIRNIFNRKKNTAEAKA
ncbi:MAG TPA: preprotein translocase subunit SecY [Candidatus Saccharibacteria bacterium]|jgi:preprotein translocase subunit SecY|nr:preprotein translocase subunit SecY [Candidatus Saccharibacteria bacterium]HMT55381.1 preprotein translocase subunit SecY [Candidatus Saccharibacteria bacterium]